MRLGRKSLNKNFHNTSYLQGLEDQNKVTNVAKYRSFQFRLLHRAIVANIHLIHWKIINSDLCTMCRLERETYTHLFIYCKQARKIWLQ